MNKDGVVRQKGVQIVDHRRELIEKRFAFEPAGRQIGRYAARRDVAVRQPGAADRLEQVEIFSRSRKVHIKGVKLPRSRP